MDQDSTLKNKLLHIETPLLHSAPLSKLASENAGRNVSVYLKMEALQPSGSFKVRGLGNTIAKAAALAHVPLHIVSSSGGNAGLSAAYCARKLGLQSTVYVPSTTEAFIQDLLQSEGANVYVVGNAWDDCDVAARQLVEKERQSGRDALYVHPFEGQDTIDGHATMVEEIRAQLRQEGIPDGMPHVISCSAGGSGLLRGILKPLLTYKEKPEILVTQCFGADSFAKSLNEARNKKVKWNDPHVASVTLPAITSEATSLGAKTCSVQAVRDALQYGDQLRSVVLEDQSVKSIAWKFARDHRVLVELACAAALAPVYFANRIFRNITDTDMETEKKLENTNDENSIVMVVIVCGGNKINSQLIEDWRLQDSASNFSIEIDGVLQRHDSNG